MCKQIPIVASLVFLLLLGGGCSEPNDVEDDYLHEEGTTSDNTPSTPAENNNDDDTNTVDPCGFDGLRLEAVLVDLRPDRGADLLAIIHDLPNEESSMVRVESVVVGDPSGGTSFRRPSELTNEALFELARQRIADVEGVDVSEIPDEFWISYIRVWAAPQVATYLAVETNAGCEIHPPLLFREDR